MKRLLLVYITITCLLIFVGCKDRNEDNIKLDTYKGYNLNTDFYKAAVLRMNPDKDDYIDVVQEITNATELTILDNSMKANEWHGIKLGEELKELPMIYMIINDDSMLALYGGHNHARIMNYRIENDKYVTFDKSDIFVLNDDAYSIILEYVGEY